MLKTYVQEMHGLDYDSITNLGFKFEEASDFYQWVLNKDHTHS